MYYTIKEKRFYFLLILQLFIVKIEAEDCLSSVFLKEECLNKTTCLNTGNESINPWCACTLTYNGTKLSNCYKDNQTCSIFRDNYCMNKSLYPPIDYVFLFGVTMVPILGFGCCLMLCGVIFTSDLRPCISCLEHCGKCLVRFFACKFCHTTSSTLPERQSRSQSNINSNVYTIETQNQLNEQIIIEQDTIQRRINETFFSKPSNGTISKPSIDSNNDDDDDDDDKESPLCVICLSGLRNKTVKTISCGHTFHEICIDEWFKEKPNKPSCPFRCNLAL